jgi:DNA-binding transcriptional ArsR family regulator
MGSAPQSDAGAQVLAAFGDPQTRRILLELDAEELDAHSLVLRTGLPQSSVYHKVRELQAAGLVAVARLAFTSEGRKVEVYRSRLREVRVELRRGRLRVELIPREDTADRLGRIWEQVRGSRGVA